ncbi:MAG TPA: DUF423 domain-containing protein [Flavisolibacter sp.]|jgi:uncharacterized membrane protein YgdD (TMEM256/DUF423 family)|nr:DUF423 domain-containing protein [Flavisolibacter sp.]
MHKTFLIAGALLAGLAVVLGAFGAHGLKKFVSPETVNTFQTGVQYQMYHAFALLVLAIVYQQFANNMMHYSGWFFLGGILLFSGSLYVLVILKARDITGLNGIGIITPIGGLLFITGWILFVLGVLKK